MRLRSKPVRLLRGVCLPSFQTFSRPRQDFLFHESYIIRFMKKKGKKGEKRGKKGKKGKKGEKWMEMGKKGVKFAKM